MNKTQLKKLKKIVSRERTLVYDALTKQKLTSAFKFCDGFKTFLDQSKTEREAVRQIMLAAEKKGFVNIDTLAGKKSRDVKKIYKVFDDRCIALAVPGKNPIESGANIIASHIDSPRLDIRQNPVYEDLSLGLMKTHYYGGIRKYHWLGVPLSLHGTVILSDNTPVDIIIGEDPKDPVFTISDLLPHLAGKLQSNKKLIDVFEGEKLNLLAGSFPLGDKKEKDRFKLGVLKELYEKYGIIEEDFVSAELEVVPAEKARDIGFDRSMIGAYGQDDRVCAYTSLQAILEQETPQSTLLALFFDKEEIGSEGSSGAKSNFLEDLISDLLVIQGSSADNRSLRKALIRSSCLSADVNAAMDPDFKDVHEPLNAAKLGFGVCMAKFTGVAGKAGSSDASAEFVGQIRHIFNENNIIWQTGELGKIDHGGGGTVAKFLAKYGMDVLDCGPALLSMHSPFEVSSKTDIYMTYLAYRTFFTKNRTGNR